MPEENTTQTEETTKTETEKTESADGETKTETTTEETSTETDSTSREAGDVNINQTFNTPAAPPPAPDPSKNYEAAQPPVDHQL